MAGPVVVRNAGVPEDRQNVVEESVNWFALDETALNLNRAADRIDDAAELDYRAAACALDDPAVMDGDHRIDEIAAQGAQARKRPVLVSADEPAEPRCPKPE
jgi:hypothetical protein